jgi:hypothetical protein
VAAPLHVRIASGFRWRLPLPADERDVLRRRVDGGVSLLAVANAADSAFSTCWPPGSRLILDRFEEAWAAGSGPVAGRLLAAFAGARAAFLTEAAVLVPYDDPRDAPVATLLVVAIDGGAAHAAWIGDQVAMVARGFQVAAATTPHTLVGRFHAEGGEPPPPQLAHIVTRTIGADAHAEPPSLATFALAPGDTVIVVGGKRPPTGELAVAAAGFLSPAALAERTVAAADGRPSRRRSSPGSTASTWRRPSTPWSTATCPIHGTARRSATGRARSERCRSGSTWAAPSRSAASDP